MDKIRLLIISEDSSARRGLSAIFASGNTFDVLGGFSLDRAGEKSVILQPDVVLLDISGDISEYLPKTSQLKEKCPCSLVIALVENEHCSNLNDVLAQGIDGCVPRGIMRGCLVNTVELACRAGIFCLPGSYKKKMVWSEIEKKNRLERPGNGSTVSGETLTRREMEILHLMAQNLSNRDIATKLFISEPTVKTHVSSILRKLGQNNRVQAIIYSYKTGLVNEPLLAHN